MKVKDAIIVHGPGRSGTTLLSNILALHEDVGWVSNYVNRFPHMPWLTYLNKLQDVSFFEKWNRDKKGFPRVSEAYDFWLHYIPNFNQPDLDAVPVQQIKAVVDNLRKIQRYNGTQKIMTKITGYSRHQSISAVFDDPCVIWIDRNPLSVIASYYKLRWGYKDKPALFQSKKKHELLREYTSKYLNFQNDKGNLEQFKLLNIAYEDLINDTRRVCKDICEFVGVGFTEKFQESFGTWNIQKRTNQGYKNVMNADDIRFVTSLLK